MKSLLFSSSSPWKKAKWTYIPLEHFVIVLLLWPLNKMFACSSRVSSSFIVWIGRLKRRPSLDLHRWNVASETFLFLPIVCSSTDRFIVLLLSLVLSDKSLSSSLLSSSVHQEREDMHRAGQLEPTHYTRRSPGDMNIRSSLSLWCLNVVFSSEHCSIEQVHLVCVRQRENVIDYYIVVIAVLCAQLANVRNAMPMLMDLNQFDRSDTHIYTRPHTQSITDISNQSGAVDWGASY